MPDRYTKGVSILIAAVFMALAVQLATPVLSGASAQSGANCATETPNPSCLLLGMRLVPNPGNPSQIMLQIATKQGTYSFTSTRPVIEQMAKDLQKKLDELGRQRI